MDSDNEMYIVSLNIELSVLKFDIKESKLKRQAGLDRLNDLRAEQALLKAHLAQRKAHRELADNLEQLSEQLALKKKRLHFEHRRIPIAASDATAESLQQQKTTDSFSCNETDLSEDDDLDDESFIHSFANLDDSAVPVTEVVALHQTLTNNLAIASEGQRHDGGEPLEERESVNHQNHENANLQENQLVVLVEDHQKTASAKKTKRSSANLTRKERICARSRDRKIDCV